MTKNAIEANIKENPKNICVLLCIEPYEMKWLESLDIKVIREKVENVDKQIFLELGQNDILFIDSSHMIRPQGDVLVEYLEILPVLKSGVLIHIHDIFTPKDYSDDWVRRDIRLWNEQYILESFLTCNEQFEIIGALNYLNYNYYAELAEKCPILKNEKNSDPGSFWIIKK